MPPKIDPNAPLATTGVPDGQQVAPPPQPPPAGPNIGLEIPAVDPVASAQLLQASAQAQMQQQLAQQITPQESTSRASAMAGLGGLLSALSGSPAPAEVGLGALDMVEQRNQTARQNAQGLISRSQDEVKSQAAAAQALSAKDAMRRAGTRALSDEILSPEQRVALTELMSADPKTGLDMYRAMAKENRLAAQNAVMVDFRDRQLASQIPGRKLDAELKRRQLQDYDAVDYSQLTGKAQQARDLKAVAEYSKDKNGDLALLGDTVVQLRTFLGNDLRGPRAKEILAKVTGNWQALFRGDTGLGSQDVYEVHRLLSSAAFQDAFRRGGKQLTSNEIQAVGTISGLDVSRTGAKNAFALDPERIAKALSSLEGGVQSEIQSRANKYLKISPKYAQDLEDQGNLFAPGGFAEAAGTAPYTRGANLDIPPEHSDDPTVMKMWKDLPLTHRRRKYKEFRQANPGSEPQIDVSEDTLLDRGKRPFGVK